MPKKAARWTEQVHREKLTYTFGKENEQAKLILQCECGREKSFTVFGAIGSVDVEHKPVYDGRGFQSEYANTVLRVRTSYLQWHCEHEDEQ